MIELANSALSYMLGNYQPSLDESRRMQAMSVEQINLHQAAMWRGGSLNDLVREYEAERMRTLPARFADFKRRLAEAQARYA